MVFSSLIFLFRFLPLVLLVYFAAPGKLKNGILFIFSLLFYSWGEPVYVLLMLFSTVVDYFHGIMTYRCKEKGRLKRARFFVISSVIINLCLLGFFKYADFFIGAFNSTLGKNLFGFEAALLNVALPIGISFYTFQTMSYTIDIYRGNALPQKNIIDFGAYVAMFPQLIAGPIVRYKTVAEELRDRSHSAGLFGEGVGTFMAGLGKKVLLANNIGMVWDTISAYGAGQITVITAWLGIFAYAFQIYFDFSGYSDMAIGLGKMFGFHFPENFQYPYVSKSITEFWRRWHISLGTWFREYVYIPLGGNRKGLGKQIRNICIVWLLTGFWHGASYNFILWGAYFAVILVLEKLFLLKALERLPVWCRHFYAILLILLGWVIFAFDDIQAGISYMGYLFGIHTAGFANGETLWIFLQNAVMFAVLIFASTPLGKGLYDRLRKKSEGYLFPVLQNIVYILLFVVCVAYITDASYNPFLYFRF